MLYLVTKENRCVDVGVIEGVRVGLVFGESRTIDAEHLQRQSGRTAEPRVRSSVRRAVGEADKRVVPSRLGVDALRVLSGKPIQYLDLRPDQSVPFGVRVTDGTACAFGSDRSSDVPLGFGYDCLQGFIEPGIGGFDVRSVFDKRRRHSSTFSGKVEERCVVANH